MWAQEPNRRPSVREIINRFRRGYLHFPNTDKKVFREYVEGLYSGSRTGISNRYGKDVGIAREKVDDPESAPYFRLASASLGNKMGFHGPLTWVSVWGRSVNI